MKPKLLLALVVHVLAVTAAALTPRSSHAQSNVPADPPGKGATGWRLTPSVRIETEYDDNVFLLSPGKRDEIETLDPGTGRFTKMESAGDLITTMKATVGTRGTGLTGRALKLNADVRYELYARNTDRSNVTLGVEAEQSLPRGRRARLRASITPSYFAKNYLVDALDRDFDGDITPDERIYATGEYREVAASFDMRFRLAKATRQRSFGALLQPSIGYYARSYETPFTGRDVNGPVAGAKLMLELNPRLGLDVGYEFASLGGTPTRQVMIIDESAFDRDFNGNGTTDDAFARAAELSDRSRTEHAVGASLGYELTKRANLSIEAEHRSRTFSSSQPFDVTNNGRSDSRNTFGAELSFKMARGVRLLIGGEIANQRINRDGDSGSTGEVTDYDRHRTRAGLSYNF